MQHTNNLDPIVTFAVENQVSLEATDGVHAETLQAGMAKGALHPDPWRLQKPLRGALDCIEETLGQLRAAGGEIVDELVGEIGFGLWAPRYPPAHAR
jgi:hypothetical protein